MDNNAQPRLPGFRTCLLADDEVAGGYETLGGGAVPEDAIRAGGAGREAGGVENLDAVAGPLAVARGLFRRAGNHPALGGPVLQEPTSRQEIGNGRSRACRAG